MKKSKIKKPRNRFVLAMVLCKRSSKFKDRRCRRGGTRNKQKEYLEDA
jgi:hypothetical protein